MQRHEIQPSSVPEQGQRNLGMAIRYLPLGNAHPHVLLDDDCSICSPPLCCCPDCLSLAQVSCPPVAGLHPHTMLACNSCKAT